MDNKYKMEYKTLCCGYNWSRDYGSSYGNRSQHELFFKFFFFWEDAFSFLYYFSPKCPKKGPYLCTVFPYQCERVRLNDDFASHHYFQLLWWFPFVFCHVVTSLGWTAWLWHWVDRWCRCSCKVFLFFHYVSKGCNLSSRVLLLPSSDLLYGWGRSYPNVYAATISLSPELLNARSLYLANI